MIALHPLALDASALAGLGRALAPAGLRTIAVDLPGFGRTPAGKDALTPARLAAPVLELAGRLRERPALLGISMGGRVALEAALAAPEVFRAAVFVAPYLPWLRLRWAMPLARAMSPRLAESVPIEKAWPLLRALAGALERAPGLADDPMAQAAVRVIYHASCPATRRAIVSAAREMALDPAFGPHGVWARLPSLRVPAAFVWGGRDRLVPVGFASPVARTCPGAQQVVLACVDHARIGRHLECLASAVGPFLAGGGPCAQRVPCRAPRAGRAPVRAMRPERPTPSG